MYAYGNEGAAIGSGESSTGETTINIHDTNPEKGVKRAFAYDGAGIGSGHYASGQTHITIRNASVSSLDSSADSTNNPGAGIGSGKRAKGNTDITIESSTVKAVGGYGAAIGSGSEGDLYSPPTGTPNALKTIIRITDSDVTASSYSSAAIGSGSYSTNATEIHINGGKIEASSYDGSGIGSGDSAKGDTDIKIKNSNVTAKGFIDVRYVSHGTGIGSGLSSSGKTTIDISGGTVKATGSGDGYKGSAGIGSGSNSTGDTSITLRDGVTVTATGGGNSSLGGGGGAGIGSGRDANGNTTILIEGATKVTATGGSTAAGIGSGHYVGDIKDPSVGSTTITIRNSNDGTVIPIIEAKGGGVENGSCWASGAGIGSGGNTLNKTTINIEGGEITATGGVSLDSRNRSDERLSGAGIGSGSNVSGETEINIKGGTITKATGGKYGGAGIGGGSSDTKDDSKKGAVTINITGGTITEATGGSEYVSSSKRWYSGAGIGAGLNAGTTTINIKDNAHIVSATGGIYGGAGIGSGSSDTKNDSKKGAVTINITDGTIEKAEGKNGGAGIGSGYYGRSSTVNISGNAELKDVRGGNLAAGIGSGYDSDKVDVVIDGGTINATGGDSAAGIGSGLNSRSSVTIKSGTVNAKGNQHSNNFGSSGIGGSYADVTISGGNITATGYDTGAGIGGSDNNNSSSITITGGNITANGTGDAPAIGNGSVSISNTGVENAGAALDITATAPDADNAIQSSDGKTLDAVIQLAENGKKGLVKLVKSGTTSISRLFHNGVYADSHPTSHSPDRVTPEMSEAEKAKYGDIASVHNWKVSDRQEPNCGKDGYIEYTCMVDHCGTTFRHTLPATGQHTWNEGVVTKEPTCTELGVRTFTCTVCHNTRTEDIPVSKTHTFGEWAITKEPTCTEKGEKQRSCTISGCVVTETEELPALGHQWSDWTPVKGDSSREYRICAVCNEVEYRDVSHNSDSSISTGLRVLDPAQADILQNIQLVQLNQVSNVLYIDVAQETASLQGVLSDLTDLRSERVETVVFSTESCTSTLSLSDIAALGAGNTPFTLSHSGSTATFTVGGVDHTALLR